MPRIRQEKARRIPEILLFVHHDQPLTPIACEPDDLRKDPKLLRLPMTTVHLHGTKTCWMPLS
jgi:hypothetical protein